MEGDQQKMRDALNNIGNVAAWVAENCNDQQTAKYMNDVIAMVQSALAAPPRQCDFSTAEEQSVRMSEFCREQYKKTDGVALCSGCRFHYIEGVECQFAWAQMPYAANEKGNQL